MTLESSKETKEHAEIFNLQFSLDDANFILGTGRDKKTKQRKPMQLLKKHLVSLLLPLKPTVKLLLN